MNSYTPVAHFIHPSRPPFPVVLPIRGYTRLSYYPEKARKAKAISPAGFLFVQSPNGYLIKGRGGRIKDMSCYDMICIRLISRIGWHWLIISL